MAGAAVPARDSLNFRDGFTVSDNGDNNSTDIINSAPGAVVGFAQIDPNTAAAELPQKYVLCPVGVTTIATLPGNSIAFEEVVTWAILAQFKKQTGGPFGYLGRMITVSNASPGNITTPNGGTSDWDITANVLGALGSAISGTSVAIVPAGSTLVVQVTTSVAVYARVAQSSVTRALLPGTGPTMNVLARTVTSGPGAGGTVTRITFDRAFSELASITLDGVSATFAAVVGQPMQGDVTSGAFFGVPGNGAIIATNVNGPGSDATGGFTYTSTLANPSTILGSTHLVAQYENTGITGSGTATGWTDVAPLGLAQNLTAHASPPINSGDSTITPAGTTASVNGSTQYFDKTGFSLGSGGTGIFIMLVSEQTANGGWPAAYNSAFLDVLTFGDHTAGHFSMTNADSGGAAVTETGSSTINALSCAWGYADSASGAGNRVQVATGTNAPQTGTGTTSDAQTSGGHFFLGGDPGLAFMTGKIVACIVANILPTSGQIAQLKAYFNTKYGV